MVISNRLQTIISCAENCDFLVDVGTDHAYIPINLIKKGVAKKAIACDISKGSIEKANKNIQEHSYSTYIETRVGDGLKVINENETPDQIIIAGMGGMLTIDILNNSKKVVNSAKRIILQPQRDIDKVRKNIHSLGLRIIDEKMLFEDGKYYNIIVCENGDDVSYSEKDYFFGKILIDEKNGCLKSQVEFELNKLKNILSTMKEKISSGKQDENFLQRFQELKTKKSLYESIGF